MATEGTESVDCGKFCVSSCYTLLLRPPCAGLMPRPARRMGTHPSGPAVVDGTEGQTLASWIAANPCALGTIAPLFGNDMPFLFKVSPYLPGGGHACCHFAAFAYLRKRRGVCWIAL